MHTVEVQVFTTQCSSSALQGDLPGEGVSSGFFGFQLLLGARKHVPPQQQHFGEMIAHKGGTWEHKWTQCGHKGGGRKRRFLKNSKIRKCLWGSPKVIRAPSRSHPACVRCRDRRLFWAAVRRRSSAILTTNYKNSEASQSSLTYIWKNH